MKVRWKMVVCLVCLAFAAAAICFGFLTVRHTQTTKLNQPVSDKARPEQAYVYFGSYPQSQVTDEALLAKLNRLPLNWKSYGYYNGDGTIGSAEQSDYMRYADVRFENETYRAVMLSDYRSYCCHEPAKISWQKLRKMQIGTVYWYRYEPIRWAVLSKEKHLLLSKMVLDTQPINSRIYIKNPKLGFDSPEFYKDPDFQTLGTDYYTSDIRAWLNSTFLETAFSEEEKAQILFTDLDNSAWTKSEKKYASKNSSDRVFLLAYEDLINPDYGFSPQAEKLDPHRVAYPTDYALSQNVWIHDYSTCYWWVRSAVSNCTPKGAALNSAVNYQGALCLSYHTPYSPDCLDTGTRPAICLTDLGSAAG